MWKNIKALFLVYLIVFLAVSLLIGILAIWNVVDNPTAKDLLVKTAYTFGAIFVVSGVIAALKK